MHMSERLKDSLMHFASMGAIQQVTPARHDYLPEQLLSSWLHKTQWATGTASFHNNTLQNIAVAMEQKNVPWWRHQMEIFSALLAICAGN